MSISRLVDHFAVRMTQTFQEENETRQSQSSCKNRQQWRHSPDTYRRTNRFDRIVNFVKIPVVQLLHHAVVLQFSQAFENENVLFYFNFSQVYRDDIIYFLWLLFKNKVNKNRRYLLVVDRRDVGTSFSQRQRQTLELSSFYVSQGTGYVTTHSFEDCFTSVKSNSFVADLYMESKWLKFLLFTFWFLIKMNKIMYYLEKSRIRVCRQFVEIF